MNLLGMRRLKIVLISSLALMFISCTTITEKQNVNNDSLTKQAHQNTAKLYLKITNSGIVCITTPCPYYNAELIDAGTDFNFDELSFTHIKLSPEQETQVRELILNDGLIVTGEKYESEGKVGKGLGIAVTEIFSPIDIKL